MALTEAASKQIVKEEFENAFGVAVDPVISDKAHTAIALAINRILLEEVTVGSGSFTNSGGAVTGTGSIS